LFNSSNWDFFSSFVSEKKDLMPIRGKTDSMAAAISLVVMPTHGLGGINGEQLQSFKNFLR